MISPLLTIFLFFFCYILILKLLDLNRQNKNNKKKLTILKKAIGENNFDWILENNKENKLEENNSDSINPILLNSLSLYNLWMRIIK